MRASVVIATTNRSASLRVLLDALRYQTFHDFEVVVVMGPCQDDTAEMLAERAEWLRVVPNDELNLSKSRNLGIDQAAGDVVAFIDDDAIPEPRWLEDLLAAYSEDEEVGGVGGLVYDTTGVNLQYRYAVCDRVGATDFDRQPPLDDFCRPGADPCIYLQGTNMSFRREVLEAVGGFDENIEYIYDDVDIAMQATDLGRLVRPLQRAAVHHKVLPSGLRREKAQITDPYVLVKNRAYFALRAGMPHRPVAEIVRRLTDQLDLLRAQARHAERHGQFSGEEARRFQERMEAGFQAGFTQGVAGQRAGRSLAPKDAAAFKAYPVLDAGERRLTCCMVSLDYPPKPMGGIARYTVDLARGFAARGHQVHVVTQADPPYRLEFEDGVWIHRYPGGERLVPALTGHPLKANLAHVVAAWRAVANADRRFSLDLVAGNVWLAEVLGCALDPRWPTVMTLSTPMRTIAATQPAVAAKPEVPGQIALEDAALRRADQLHPLSQANLRQVREHAPAASPIPAEVLWLGMPDRARGGCDPPVHEGVEILFVGRLEPRKGVDTLIQAAVDVLRSRSDARLRMVGADNPYASDDPRPYRDRVAEELASEPEVLRRISFEGEVSEAMLDEHFRECDIFCAPSRYESFGLMNLEAMMFSRPVISCRAGGIPEVVDDGETGLLVEPDDARALADALRTLIDDPDLRRRMGVAARRRYESEFTNDIAVQRILGLFQEVAHRSGRSDVTADDAEAAVQRGLADVIRELGGVDDPDAAAEQLVDPVAFPEDYMAAIARLRDLDDHQFVNGLYQAILHRSPDVDDLAYRADKAAGGEQDRLELVHEVATSDEAALRGVDTRFLQRLAPTVRGDLADGINGVGPPRPSRSTRILQRAWSAPATQRARRMGQRVLRDPRVRGLEQDVRGLRNQIETVTRLTAELRELNGQPNDLGWPVRSGSFGTYLGNGRVLVGLRWGGMLLVPADDLSLTPELVTRGIYEEPFTRYLMRTLTVGQTAVDVGANVGMYTVLMAALVGTQGHVVAFEPNPDVLPFLRENVAVNWLNEQVTIRPTGAAAGPGTTTLYATERFRGNSSLLQPGPAYFTHTPMDTVREVEIQLESLDQSLDQVGRVGLIKIDVEGAEHLVLQGMSELVAGQRVDRVAFEVYRERMGEPWVEFSSILRRYAANGWRFHDIAGDGTLTILDLEQVLSVGRYSQIVMCAPWLRD